MENLFTMPKKIVILGSLFFLFSCAQEELLNDDSLKTTSETLTEKWSIDKLNVFKGPKVAVGNDSVRSWISVRKETGLPHEIGIEMTPEALQGLPTVDNGATIVAPLHIKARQLTPFTHVGVNWQPYGHNNTPFIKPHFDIHFYIISNEERKAIPEYSASTAAAFNLPLPGSDYMPLDYSRPPAQGAAYPQMGKHWLPISLASYLPFTKIMVYGSYNGKFIFVEPMIALDYLLSNVDSKNNDYSQPLKFEKAGYYPTKYNIYRDPKTGNIKITLSNFIPRAATPN